MRISTAQIFDRGISAIQDRQAELIATQQQVATGRRIVTPADDPIGAAQVLQLTQADDTNTRYRTNRDYAQGQLTLAESTIAQATDVLQAVREQAVAAGNGSYSNAEFAKMADDVAGRLDQLVAIANATDAQGHYLFSGYQGSTQPFVVAPSGAVQFQGDDGQRLVQAGAARQIALNVSGAAVFQRIPTGNGTFTWAAGAANTGAGVIGPGSVTNPALVTGHNYQITFTVAGGVTTYNVVDTTTATTVLAAQPYGGGPASIAFDGLQVDIQGAPANGDTFTISPSTDQSVFTTIQKLIAALRSGGSTARVNGLNNALTDLDQALQQALSQRADVGTRLREIDASNSAGEQAGLQYQSARSTLQDTDYAKAISDLTREQLTLQAAQQSFAKVSQLSLFDYLA
jgi:flagellar hook-associated protein 3 FlgL